MDGIRPSAGFKRIRWAAIAVGICVICICGGVLAAPSGGGTAKQAEKIEPVPTRSVCANVASGHARCLSDISLNKYSNPDQAVQPDTSGGYGPVEFHTAYQLPCKPGGAVAGVCSAPGNFGPQTIAIVDAGGYGGSLPSDLQKYDNYYGLPACTTANGCLTVMNQSGSTSPLPSQVSTGWSEEIALDVETAHMVCQTCKVTLVEANDDLISNLAAAETTAAGLSPVAISNSWGSDSDLSSYDNDFKHNGMAVVAATGDDGTLSGGESWPADIPQVVAAAGSTLQLNTDNTWASETVWSGSGGGCSTTYSAPSWQTSRGDWASGGCSGSGRAFGDLSADANPSTGAAVVFGSSWYLIGGTSLATPLIASMYALADDVPVGTYAVTLPYQEASASTLHDITSGNDCTGAGQPNCTAKAGFDVPSGLGTPKGLGLFKSGSSITLSYNSTLPTGSALNDGDGLGSSTTSPAYKLVMQGDGNLVLYKSSSGRAVWSTGTNRSPKAVKLVLQDDGNLVLYSTGGKAVWSSGTNTDDADVRATKLVMQGDGNLVLYTSSGLPAWSSGTGKINLADATELQAGQSLSMGQMLGSSLVNPVYRLLMQNDGNLVVYKGGKAIWQSHTGRTGSDDRLVMQRDGNLVIYTSSGRAAWSTGTNRNPKAVRLVMQGDGNLVLYSSTGKAVWHI